MENLFAGRWVNRIISYFYKSIDELNATVGRFKLAKVNRRCWERKGCAAEIRARCPAYRSEEERCWLIEGTWCGGAQQDFDLVEQPLIRVFSV